MDDLPLFFESADLLLQNLPDPNFFFLFYSFVIHFNTPADGGIHTFVSVTYF